jgi:sRNA-binding carbon storage regulator CsrA
MLMIERDKGESFTIGKETTITVIDLFNFVGHPEAMIEFTREGVTFSFEGAEGAIIRMGAIGVWVKMIGSVKVRFGITAPRELEIIRDDAKAACPIEQRNKEDAAGEQLVGERFE